MKGPARFFLWQTRGPLAAVVVASGLAGLAVALLFGIPEILSACWRIRGLERRLGKRPPDGTEAGTKSSEPWPR